MNILARLWSRLSIPPASAEAAVVSLEAGATLTVPRGDVRHVVRVAQRDGRLPVLVSRPFTDDEGRRMVMLKRGKMPRRKKR